MAQGGKPSASRGDRDRPRRGATRPGGVRLFLRAAGAPFWTASALPVIMGSTLPFWLRPPEFVFSWLNALEAIIAIVLIHAGSDLANEYYDFKSSADTANPNRGGLSGGSGILPDGAASERFLAASFIACYVAGAALGIHLNAVTPGNTILIIGAAGVLGGFFYTAPPLRLSYRGLGEIVLGLCFGVLPVVGAYYLQTHSLSWQVVVASLPMTFAIVNVLWVNQLPDFIPDRDSGKRTLVVRMGTAAGARGGVTTLVLLIFATLFLGVFTASVIPLSLVAVLAFGLARTVVVDSWKHHSEPTLLVEAQDSALKLHLTIGLIMALSPLVAIGS